jgi:hypothetical protein
MCARSSHREKNHACTHTQLRHTCICIYIYIYIYIHASYQAQEHPEKVVKEHRVTVQKLPEKVVKRLPGMAPRHPEIRLEHPGMRKMAGLPGITARPEICRKTTIMITDIINMMICMSRLCTMCVVVYVTV